MRCNATGELPECSITRQEPAHGEKTVRRLQDEVRNTLHLDKQVA